MNAPTEDARPDCPKCHARMMDGGAALWCYGTDGVNRHPLVTLLPCGGCGAACWPDEIVDENGQLCAGCNDDAEAFAGTFGPEDERAS